MASTGGLTEDHPWVSVRVPEPSSFPVSMLPEASELAVLHFILLCCAVSYGTTLDMADDGRSACVAVE